MKRRFIHTLLLFISFTFISAGVNILYAQDAGFPSDNTYQQTSEEKVVYSPGGEGDPIVTTHKATTTSRDSTATVRQQPRMNPAAEPTKVTRQAPDDDSVLSFNFLYYIIRKYKLQDIID